jgi:hypothetical protein
MGASKMTDTITDCIWECESTLKKQGTLLRCPYFDLFLHPESKI